MATKRRFIAGAVCPRCSVMDKIVMYREDDKDFRECVGCGFTDELRIGQTSQELETRVNKKEVEVQVIEFGGPKAASSKSDKSD